MIFEGVNDIGVEPASISAQEIIGDRLIQAYGQIVDRLHDVGVPVFAATITPFSAPIVANGSVVVQPYSDPEREKTRVRVNDWIKDSGVFDYVFDFAAVVADPDVQSMLAQEYNSGDYLHPNVAGYQAIADSFPLEVFGMF